MPLNYTRGSQAIEAAFRLTGDTARYDLSHVTNLLDNGVTLVMANGDRDYRCNCKKLSYPLSGPHVENRLNNH